MLGMVRNQIFNFGDPCDMSFTCTSSLWKFIVNLSVLATAVEKIKESYIAGDLGQFHGKCIDAYVWYSNGREHYSDS